MTNPDEHATKEFFYAWASALAISQQLGATPAIVLPPREPGAGPAARRAAVQIEVAELAREMNQVLAHKTLPPASPPTATLGRQLVSRGERVDRESQVYHPGPGLDALLGALAADAKEMEE